MTDYQALLDQCHKPFRYWELQKNFKGHLYASVQATQARLNSLGVPWNLTHNSLVVERYTKLVPKKDRGKPVYENGKPVLLEKTYYDAFASVNLDIPGLGTRMGTGADDNEDSDTAIKSALAYALRKAGNQFGIAWYITDKPEAEVELWTFLKGADLDDTAILKRAVKMVAEIEGVTPKEWLERHKITSSSNAAGLYLGLRNDGRI